MNPKYAEIVKHHAKVLPRSGIQSGLPAFWAVLDWSIVTDSSRQSSNHLNGKTSWQHHRYAVNNTKNTNISCRYHAKCIQVCVFISATWTELSRNSCRVFGLAEHSQQVMVPGGWRRSSSVTGSFVTVLLEFSGRVMLEGHLRGASETPLEGCSER